MCRGHTGRFCDDACRWTVSCAITTEKPIDAGRRAVGSAAARFVEAMGGTLEPEDTPGGGLTMVVSLPVEKK